MRRVQRMKNLLGSTAGSSIQPGHPPDDALLELLIHMASSDGMFQDAEVEMLESVLSSWSSAQVRALIGQVAARTLDLDLLAAKLETDDDRWRALRFAARMASRDGHIDDDERKFLTSMADALNIGAGGLERIEREMLGPPANRLNALWLRMLFSKFSWDAADFADGGVLSRDLLPVVPEGAEAVMRIGVDSAEVMGIYKEGIVARFLEGPAFLEWTDIIALTSGVGLESSVRIHTLDGRIWSLVDARMSGIKLVFDRLYRPDEVPEELRATRPNLGEMLEAPPREHTWDETWDEFSHEADE